jgi:hypothetical protein
MHFYTELNISKWHSIIYMHLQQKFFNIYTKIALIINYLRDTFTQYDISRIKFKCIFIKSPR